MLLPSQLLPLRTTATILLLIPCLNLTLNTGHPWRPVLVQVLHCKVHSLLGNLEVFQHTIAVMNKVISLVWYYGLDIEILFAGEDRQKLWGAGIAPSLSWLRPMYYTGIEIPGFPDTFRNIICHITDSVRLRTEGADTILHTDILVFGLVFHDMSAVLNMFDGIPVNPPFGLISKLSEVELEFAITVTSCLILVI